MYGKNYLFVKIILTYCSRYHWLNNELFYAKCDEFTMNFCLLYQLLLITQYLWKKHYLPFSFHSTIIKRIMKSTGVSATFRPCGERGRVREFSRLLPAALPPHCRQPPSFQPDPEQWHGFYTTGDGSGSGGSPVVPVPECQPSEMVGGGVVY